jgi:hypothetical protein
MFPVTPILVTEKRGLSQKSLIAILTCLPEVENLYFANQNDTFGTTPFKSLLFSAVIGSLFNTNVGF